MALNYDQSIAIAGQPMYQGKMATALHKQAMARILSAVDAELALCRAIIKNPTIFTSRFLLDALLQNAAGLTSTNGSTLDSPIADSAVDTAVTAQWAAQILAGI